MPRGPLYNPKGTKTADGRRGVLARLVEMCEEQGVDPQETLNAEDVKKFMVLTHAEKNMITLIGSGYPVRNANAILRAIEMKLDRSAPRPAASGADAGAVTVTVNTLGQDPATVSVAAPEGVQVVKKLDS